MSSIVLKIPYESQSYYLVMVEDDKVDQARAALEMVGTFVPEEGV